MNYDIEKYNFEKYILYKNRSSKYILKQFNRDFKGTSDLFEY